MDNVAAYRRIMRKEPSRGWGGERQTHAPADGQERPLSGKEQFIGHIAETEPQKRRGDGKPYGPFQHFSEGLHKIIHGTVLRGHKVEGAAQLFMIE